MLVDFFFGDFTEIADKFVAGFRLEIALVEDDAEWALELDGHLVYMELSYESDDYNLYSIPILLNGEA